MCRSLGTQRNASLKVAGFDRSFNRSSLAGFHRSLTMLPYLTEEGGNPPIGAKLVGLMEMSNE
jgi:hypothetical protein